MMRVASPRDAIALLDVGSTFTKVVLVDGEGRLRGRARVPTIASDIGIGMEAALAAASDTAEVHIIETVACSSAGGGLRVGVLGLEERLTLESARRTATGAGARIVFAHSGTLDGRSVETLLAAAPDVILLTGGTNGGDRRTIVGNAHRLRDASAGAVVVVAGNDDAQHVVARALGTSETVVFARNVLPQIGQLDVEDAQRVIRTIFVDHVMGKGRFVSRSPLARAIRMPTPAAVLDATRELARIGRSTAFGRPVVVDVGGATTDVHSALPLDPHDLAYGREPVPSRHLTRTVEGDLGLRESAPALVDEAIRTGYLDPDDARRLGPEAGLRERNRAGGDPSAYVDVDDELARLASAIGLARHAGSLSISLTRGGATLRKTGRDLRRASCVVATGGVFEARDESAVVVADAIEFAHARGALVPACLPVVVDRSYVLAAAGLLTSHRPDLARRLLREHVVSNGALACV